jgi:hypothetical protein
MKKIFEDIEKWSYQELRLGNVNLVNVFQKT